MRRCFALILALWPGHLMGHPHVFIDAGLDFRTNDRGEIAAVRVTWAYDAFYSLLTVQDRGMDRDGDGALTDAELKELARTDVEWDDGFPGDLSLSLQGAPVGLGPPLGFLALYKNDRLVTSHIRPLTPPLALDDAPLIARVYDATYYTAYEVTLPVTLRGRSDCRVARHPADTGAAQAKLTRMLRGAPEPEFDFPEIGAAFADTFEISCGG